MTPAVLVRRFVILRALRWAPLGLGVPFFVLLPQARGLSLAQIGLVWSVHSVVNIVFEVPSGGLADAVGRRAALAAGALLTAVGLGLFGVAAGVPAFMLAVAAIAVGRSLISGSLEAWFVDEVTALDPDIELHRPMAKGGTAEGIGVGAGAALGGLLPFLGGGLPDTGDAAVLQLSLPLLAGAAVALLYAATIARLVRETTRPQATGWREAITLTREGLGVARRSANVRKLLAIGALVGVVMSSVEVLWQPRLGELLGGDPGDFAFLFGTLAAASMLVSAGGTALAPRIVDRLGRRGAFLAGFGLTAATLGLLALAPTTVLFSAVFLLVYGASGLTYPLEQEVLHEGLEGRTRATVASAHGLAMQVGAFGGNLGLVPLAGVTGIGLSLGAGAALLVVAGLIAGAISLPAAVRPRPRPAAPSGAA